MSEKTRRLHLDNAIMATAFITEALGYGPMGPLLPDQLHDTTPAGERAFIWSVDNFDDDNRVPGVILRINDQIEATIEIDMDVCPDTPAYMAIPTYCLLNTILCIMVRGGTRFLMEVRDVASITE